MTGFLQSLLRRAEGEVGSSDLLRRRRPSLFEPAADSALVPPPSVPPEPALHAAEELRLARRPPSEPWPMPLPAEPRAVAPAVASPAALGEPMAPPRRPQATTVDPTITRSPAAPASRAGDDRAAHPTLLRALDASPPQTSHRRADTGSTAGDDRSPPHRKRPLPSAPYADESRLNSDRTLLAPAPPLHLAAPALLPTPRKAIERAERTMPPTAPPLRERPASAPLATTRAAPRFDDRTVRPAAPPTVQVTIGRLEVKAVAPPADTNGRAAKPTGPRLALDAYLRARHGGSS